MIVIVLLCVGTVLDFAVWLHLDQYFPISDDAEHLYRAIDVFNISNHLSLEKLPQLLQFYAYYPPLFYFVSAIFFSLFGLSYSVALSTNLLFYVILIGSIYSVGKNLSGDKGTGLWSAFLVVMYPGVFGMGRSYMLDFALLAWFSLLLSFIVKEKNKGSDFRRIAIGIIAALGSLLKMSFLFFMFFSLTWLFLHKRKALSSSALMLSQLLQILVPFSLILSPFIFVNFTNILSGVNLLVFKEAAEISGHLRGAEVFLYYVLGLFNSQLLFGYTVIFFASLFHVLRYKKEYRGFAALHILIPYIVFSIIPIKDLRFLSPYLGAIGVISAFGLVAVFRRIQSLLARRLLSALFICVALANYFWIQYAPAANEMRLRLPSPVKIFSNDPKRICGVHFKIENGDMVKLLDSLFLVLSNAPRRVQKVGIISDNDGYLQYEAMNLFGKMRGGRFVFSSLVVTDPKEFISRLESFDALLMKKCPRDTDDLIRYFLDAGITQEAFFRGGIIEKLCNGPHLNETRLSLKEFFGQLKEHFSLYETIHAQNESVFILLRKPAGDVSEGS